MAERTYIYPSGMIIDGIIRYRRTETSYRRLAVETVRRFRFFSPLPTRWRAMQRLKDVLENLYGVSTGPDWSVDYEYELPVEAPLSMRGHAEGFLPVPEKPRVASEDERADGDNTASGWEAAEKA